MSTTEQRYTIDPYIAHLVGTCMRHNHEMVTNGEWHPSIVKAISELRGHYEILRSHWEEACKQYAPEPSDRLMTDAIVKPILDALRDGEISSMRAYECLREWLLEGTEPQLPPPSIEEKQEMKVTDEMVTRFLGWRLPENFRPDAGISFNPEYNVEYNAARGLPPARHQPTGTNLLDHGQAKAMLEYVLASSPEPAAKPRETWAEFMLRKGEYRLAHDFAMFKLVSEWAGFPVTKRDVE